MIAGAPGNPAGSFPHRQNSGEFVGLRLKGGRRRRAMGNCRTCGLPEGEHNHDFVPMPDGCVCGPEVWSGWDAEVGEVCDRFDGSIFCTTCGHDKECHKEIAT
jgi:hypothetical protein